MLFAFQGMGNAVLLEILQALINGLALGSLYALIAVGYSLVFGVLQFVNFAHAELFMVGAYFVMTLLMAGAPLPVAIVLGVLGVGAFAIVLERVCYKPLRKAGRLAPLITAIGLSLFLQNFVQFLYSPNPQSYPVQLPSDLIEMFDGDLFIRSRDIIIFAVTLGLTAALEVFIHKTKPGAGIRALAMHPQAARLVGVPFDRTISLTFFLGACMAVVAGGLQGMAFNQIWPLMGVSAGLKAFAAAVLGGIGVLSGSLLGGLVLGVAESFLVTFELSTYKDGLAFLILIVVLLLRPQGLLGKARLVKV